MHFEPAGKGCQVRFRVDGKMLPVVLLPGRPGPASGGVLYALILAGGDLEHPAFASLPSVDAADAQAGHSH